jgi:hypothetical protein
MKQETLEEGAKVFAKTQVVRGRNIPEWDNKVEEIITRNFIAGAKWQQEKLLSFDEEELVKTDNDKLLFQVGILRGMLHQRESMYSEEEMISFMQFIISQETLDNTSSVSKETAKYYLEQFKKKQEKVICPLCKGKEYSITKSGFKCAYTDCQKEW